MALPVLPDAWLTGERLRVYPRIFLMSYVIVIICWVLMADGVFDSLGQPLGTDFTSFYTASQLALSGHASLAYDFVSQFEAEKAIMGRGLVNFYSFSYPPTFMLILMPFGVFPYLVALFVWLGLTLFFFVFMVQRLAARREAALLSMAFPAVFVTVGHGQNALLTAGLFAGALHYLDRKPLLAGVLIGLLTFKPHLGVLIPFVLILSGRWRVFFLASICSAVFAAVSWVVLGFEPWRAFFASTSKAASILNEGMVPFYKMQSLYASLRLMGLTSGVAYALHGLLALIAVAVVLWVWRQSVDLRLKYAALGAGSLMVTPFLLDYDLAILAVPIACLATYGLRYGFRPGLINVLCIAWLAPIMVRTFNFLVAMPWTQIVILALLYQIVSLCRGHATKSELVS